MSAASFPARLVEFYTLQRARSAQEKLGAARSEIADLVELGRQRASAAEALFAVGHTVEALRLALEAAEVTKDAASRFAHAAGLSAPAGVGAPKAKAEAKPAEAKSPDAKPGEAAGEEKPAEEKPVEEKRADADEKPSGSEAAEEKATEAKPPEGGAAEEKVTDEETAGERPVAVAADAGTSWRVALADSAASPSTRAAAERTLAEAETTKVPRLEAEVTPAHATFFRDLARARAVLSDAIAPATLTRAEIGFTRVWRPLVTAVLVVAGLYGTFVLFRQEEGTFVRGSATWADSPDFQPERAIDGNDGPMWILPDGQTGFLEVRFVPARRIDRVTLVNAGNGVIIDRGTNEYALEIWSDGGVARSFDGSFTAEPGGTAEHEVGIDEVDRIRFLVRSNHHLSGGLSELRWE